MKKLISNQIFWLFLIILLAGILRLPLLDLYPPALFSDEVSQGYNAYSIMKTGKDEVGTFLPVSIRSFGDWKPPLTTYLIIPTIALFGLNAYGVRLPTALLGTATVWIIFLLAREILYIFDKNNFIKFKVKISLMTALFLSISPWHILQSRSAMLVGIMLFCFCLSIWAFLKSIHNIKYIYLSVFGFALTIYSYYGARVVVPLILILFICYFKNFLLKNIKHVFLGLLFGIFLFIPLFINFIHEPDVVFGRAKTVSIFYDRGIELTIRDLQIKDGINYPILLTKFFHNKPYYYSTDILRRILQHFDMSFLVLKGDSSNPFIIPNMGIIYFFDLFLITFGLIYLLRNKLKLMVFLLFWIIIALIPASLTFMTPATNRTLNMLPVLNILAAIGLIVFFKKIKLNKFTISIVIIIISSNLIFFLYQYFIYLPQYHPDYWQYGYKELFAYLKDKESKNDYIYMSGKLTMPYIFKLFYDQTDPLTLEKDLNRNYKVDEVGFEYVDSYKNYQFIRYFDWNIDKEKMQKNSLLVTRADDKLGGEVNLIKQIIYPDGNPVFNIYSI